MDKITNVSYRFLGIRVHALTKPDLLVAIENVIKAGTPNSIIGNHNLHSLYLCQSNAEIRRFYDRNTYTHVDGMSIIILARIFGVPLGRIHRTGYLDWFDDFLSMAEKNSWRIYFLGGRPKVASGLLDKFHTVYPNLQLCSHHGYDAFEHGTTVFEEIKAFAPHVLMVGMGMPLQERWIETEVLSNRINVNLILSCGAIMDYYMGAQKAAPRWLGQIGLEWMYRLVRDPKRLFFRYVIEPVTLLPLIICEWRKRKNYAR